MTGIEDENRQAFRAAGVRLREAGHVPVLPMDHEPAVGRHGGKPDWHDYIAADILAMADVEGIAYLPGASESPGSRIERIVAERMGLCLVPLLPVWEHAAPEPLLDLDIYRKDPMPAPAVGSFWLSEESVVVQVQESCVPCAGCLYEHRDHGPCPLLPCSGDIVFAPIAVLRAGEA